MIDGYWHENEPVGTDKSLDLTIGFRPEVSLSTFNAATAVSPKEACVRHLNHLMQHKSMGADEMQATIKLADYVEALAEFPEWVIWQVCKNLIIDDKRGFVPSIVELKEHCGLVQEALERRREGAAALEAPMKPKRAQEQISRKEKNKKEWTHEEWVDWVMDAEKMVNLAKNNPAIFNVEEWQIEVDRRKAEFALENPFGSL